MNTITQPNHIIEEVKNLITYSITNPDVGINYFNTMHRAIIKKYFEAKNVEINYTEQTVEMQIPVGNKQYTNITFECQNLQRFLKACLKKDNRSLEFYQSLLTHYNVTHAA
ncbi:MAG TPA: hypothetical protein VLO29_05595 [Salegentibacter sp.]|nr:hypothetical protein [Salegentibacter sp.]